MTIYKEKIINLQSGEETWRDYTLEEIAEIEAVQEAARIKTEQAAAKEAARQALLAKLGITEDEAKLLLS